MNRYLPLRRSRESEMKFLLRMNCLLVTERGTAFRTQRSSNRSGWIGAWFNSSSLEGTVARPGRGYTCRFAKKTCKEIKSFWDWELRDYWTRGAIQLPRGRSSSICYLTLNRGS